MIDDIAFSAGQNASEQYPNRSPIEGTIKFRQIELGAESSVTVARMRHSHRDVEIFKV